jgi:protein-L-isoaspartate(D-aspartate) O-methyltransferase
MMTSHASILDFTSARLHMVESQLRPNKVTDERLLTAMETLPREMFVPPAMQGLAYLDEDIEIAPRRYLMEPMILGRLLQNASLTPTDKVLVVGPGTGYAAALLAGLVSKVVALEENADLFDVLKKNIASLNLQNVQPQAGLLRNAAAVSAPYNVILFEGSVEEVPGIFLEQLAEGGRLLAVMPAAGTPAAKVFQAMRYTKLTGYVSAVPLFDANIKPLPSFEKAKVFKL